MGLEQYSIVVVDLEPTIGSEMKKTRPCVILSPIEMNDNLNTIIISPLTTSTKKYPSRVKVKFQNKNGSIALDHIRTIDKKRIESYHKKITPSEIASVKETLLQMLIQ